MPDRICDDGFKKTLPLFWNIGWEGFLEPGWVRRPARTVVIQSFREKKHRIRIRFPATFSRRQNKIDIENIITICSDPVPAESERTDTIL